MDLQVSFKEDACPLIIILIYPSLVLSLISLTVTVTKVTSPIFVLSVFASSLFFVIVSMGKLMGWLGGGRQLSIEVAIS